MFKFNSIAEFVATSVLVGVVWVLLSVTTDYPMLSVESLLIFSGVVVILRNLDKIRKTLENNKKPQG